MTGPSPQCYIPSHKAIGPLILEKKIFGRGFTIYGRGGHLGHVTQTLRTNFRFPIPLRLHMKFGFDRPSGFGEDLWKWWMTGGRADDGWMDDGPWLYYKLTNELNGSGELKSHCFTLLPYKSIRDQIWLSRKIGQGQHSVIIWTNLEVLEHPMLYTNFQGHRHFGSGEEEVLSFFTIYGHGGQLGHATSTSWTNFHSPSHGGSIWNLTLTGPEVSEDKMFENVDTYMHT